MFYPENFLRVLGKGASERVQLLEFWKDVESYYVDVKLLDTPETTPSIEWIKTTEWYVNGGYKELRAKAYFPIGEQLDMQFHDRQNGTTTHHDHIAAVKEKWCKPC